MPELFIELFSEEIPARAQVRGATELMALVGEMLAPLAPRSRVFFGPRRVALAAEVAACVAGSVTTERGPRVGAPEQAVAGFLRKHSATRDALRQDGGFWVLDRHSQAVDAASLIAGAMPGMLRRFAWPKSMRWGGTSAFTWIRPLRRIACLLDGAVVDFDLARDGDDGHGLAAGNLTEGHRFHAPGTVAVTGVDAWQAALRARYVVVDAAERTEMIRTGIAAVAAAQDVSVVDDAGLVDEVAGLVEWPVPLLGRIDAAFVDLPPEIMQVSMRVNQRYFATRNADGRAAPWFAFVANIAAADGGAAIVAGNERVLRARFSDARHFWDLDRRTRLADRVAALDGVTFHTQLGTQGDRVRRLVRLAGTIAPLVGADVARAERAALLAKADLTTGLVGEFPELQGVMGGYYAKHDGEHADIVAGVREHYAPKGPSDSVPSTTTGIAVALADKLDQLAAFFSVDLCPTGSSDPYSLRRAALGVIRTIRENTLCLDLAGLVSSALEPLTPDIRLNSSSEISPQADDIKRLILKPSIISFLGERLRVQLKSEGVREDLFKASLGTLEMRIRSGFDIMSLLSLCSALSTFLTTQNGIDLLAGYKRATNILKIESGKGWQPQKDVDRVLLRSEAEIALYVAATTAHLLARTAFVAERFDQAATALAMLRAPLDAFFTNDTVNDPVAELRENRLRLLKYVETVFDEVADFSQIEA